jgi:dephospho-CoA kinase
MALVVGLAGFYCSGKSTLAAGICAHFGWEQIEVDHVGHQALVACRNQIVATFGHDICATDGSIDRKILGKIV